MLKQAGKHYSRHYSTAKDAAQCCSHHAMLKQAGKYYWVPFEDRTIKIDQNRSLYYNFRNIMTYFDD